MLPQSPDQEAADSTDHLQAYTTVKSWGPWDTWACDHLRNEGYNRPDKAHDPRAQFLKKLEARHQSIECNLINIDLEFPFLTELLTVLTPKYSVSNAALPEDISEGIEMARWTPWEDYAHKVIPLMAEKIPDLFIVEYSPLWQFLVDKRQSLQRHNLAVDPATSEWQRSYPLMNLFFPVLREYSSQDGRHLAEIFVN
eukprot:GHVQ01040371.1.p1 GENE.GHVQ01040371.1~~GHVQ01040371.1.p1  ORF type:complete len:197 (+),score=16.30 GHVQ01040371.1:310-900(+)